MDELLKILIDIGREAAGQLLDLVYPPALYCICCGKIIDATRPYRLCNECMEGIKWATGRICLKCGKPLSESNPGRECFDCREHGHLFDRGFTCAEYGEHERSIVLDLKYKGSTHIAATLAEILHDRLELLRSLGEMPEYDLILPVPMHRAKERARGFNQAALIAKELSRLEDRPWTPDAILRVRGTKAMRGLSPEERRRNIRGAFEISPLWAGQADRLPVLKPAQMPGKHDIRTKHEKRPIGESLAGLRVLIVDDLYTTGATVDAMTEELRQAGVREVYVLSFAAAADVPEI